MLSMVYNRLYNTNFLVLAGVGASRALKDKELIDARPDQEEMEEAINRFVLQMEKQEKMGFKDLASVLSLLPKPAQGSVFFLQWMKIRPICSLHLSFTCTDMLRTTG